MFPSFKTADEAIAALKTEDMIFGFRYLMQQNHPYIYRYLWDNGYYREEAEAILQTKKYSFDNRVFKKLQSYGIDNLFALLSLLGEANPADARKFLLWREFLPKPLHTVYVIDSEIGATVLLTVIVNFRESEFFMVGQSNSIEESYEPLLRLRPDIVVIRHPMNFMSGVEATQLFKPYLPDTAFLLRATYLDLDEHLHIFEEANRAGVDHFEYSGMPLSHKFISALRTTLEKFQQRAL